MYRRKEIKGYIPDLLPHQLYFIQRWGELFEKSPLHYRKLSYPCVRAVLKEAVQVVEHYRTEILYEHNIFEIFQEVINTLKKNKVLSTRFKEDWNLVSTRLRSFLSDKQSFINISNTIEKYRKIELPLTLIKGLLNKLENTDIPRMYKDHLSNQLEKPTLSFEIVDDYLELLMSELLYEGHHKQYLYNWGKVALVNGAENTFLKRLEQISELGNKNRREFECFIKLKLPDGYESIIGTNGPLTFFNDPDRARILIDEEHEVPDVHTDNKVINFFDTDKHIARMKLFATDDISALNIARDELISTTRLFTLENRHKQYNPGNISEVLVFDNKRKQINTSPHVVINQHGLHVKESDKYIKINLSSKLTGRYKGLDQLLQWCRVIQDSPKETGLVAMWSLMEYLFVTEPTNKRKNVIEYTTPYIMQFYLKSLVFRCRTLIKENQTANNALIDAVKSSFGNESIDRNEVKLHYLLQFVAEKKDIAFPLFETDSINQRYIGLLNKFMQIRGTKLWFFEYLKELEKQIECDLSRAYRLRNILTHQAYVDKVFFEEIYEKSSFYLKLILDDLLYSMSLQPDNTLHQLVRIKKESYNDYQKLVSGITSIDSYKALLMTKSLLV